MKNIHILPTNKPSKLFIDIDNDKLTITNNPIGGEHMMNRHIYITSNEEIKEWYIYKSKLLRASVNHSKYEILYGKTVILTTDQYLIKDGVQAINDKFIEWFCSKKGKVDFVEVIPIEDEKN